MAVWGSGVVVKDASRLGVAVKEPSSRRRGDVNWVLEAGPCQSSSLVKGTGMATLLVKLGGSGTGRSLPARLGRSCSRRRRAVLWPRAGCGSLSRRRWKRPVRWTVWSGSVIRLRRVRSPRTGVPRSPRSSSRPSWKGRRPTRRCWPSRTRVVRRARRVLRAQRGVGEFGVRHRPAYGADDRSASSFLIARPGTWSGTSPSLVSVTGVAST